MVRILFLLSVFWFSSATIANGQSEGIIAKKSCDRATPATAVPTEPRQEQNGNSDANGDRRLMKEQNRGDNLENNLDNSVLPKVPVSKPQKVTNEEIITEKNNVAISAEPRRVAIAGIPLPSLWWAKQQFDPFNGKLIDNWLAYPQIKQVDVTVNWQLWTLLDYLGRYRFINQFGTVAREYGYSLRIFNQQQQCLALYEYDETTNPPKWKIHLEGLGQDSLQVEPVEREAKR